MKGNSAFVYSHVFLIEPETDIRHLIYAHEKIGPEFMSQA